jgi:hypothetical protein
MAPLLCQKEHDTGKLPGRTLFPLIAVTDLVVLAEPAQKVAGAEKHGPGPVLSDQRGLLPEVGAVACDAGKPAGPAKAFLALQAVYTAGSRAQPARFEQGHRFFCTTTQFTRSRQFQVDRLHDFSKKTPPAQR